MQALFEVKKHCRFVGNGIAAAVLKCGFCCCVVALLSGCLLSERIAHKIGYSNASSFRKVSYDPSWAAREGLAFGRVLTSPLAIPCVGFALTDGCENENAVGIVFIAGAAVGSWMTLEEIGIGLTEALTCSQYKDPAYPWEFFGLSKDRPSSDDEPSTVPERPQPKPQVPVRVEPVPVSDSRPRTGPSMCFNTVCNYNPFDTGAISRELEWINGFGNSCNARNWPQAVSYAYNLADKSGIFMTKLTSGVQLALVCWNADNRAGAVEAMDCVVKMCSGLKGSSASNAMKLRNAMAQGNITGKFTPNECTGADNTIISAITADAKKAVDANNRAINARIDNDMANAQREASRLEFEAKFRANCDYFEKAKKDFDPDRPPQEGSPLREQWESTKRIHEIFK